MSAIEIEMILESFLPTVESALKVVHPKTKPDIFIFVKAE
jgi:hypothetical protein